MPEKAPQRIPERVEISLPSTLGYEKVARGAAEAVAEEMGFSKDRIEDLKTAVSEACMNAIEHGNLESGTASVTVYLTAENQQLEISVADEGLQSMPDDIPKPGRLGEGEDNRGWGMFFISQMVDEVEITRLPSGGNRVKMTIYLQSPTDGGKGGDDEEDGKRNDTKPVDAAPADTKPAADTDAKPAVSN